MISVMNPITITVSFMTAAIAALFDWQTGKIPNLLTFPAMVFGVVYTFINFGWGLGIERCVLLIILFLFGALSIVGMGDLKLLMALGAISGSLCLLITVAISAVLLLIVEGLRHRRETWVDIKAGWLSLRNLRFDPHLGTGRKTKFAPYLLCGLIGGVVICCVM